MEIIFEFGQQRNWCENHRTCRVFNVIQIEYRAKSNEQRAPTPNFVINFPLNNLIKFNFCVAYNMQWAMVTHQPSPHQSDPTPYPLIALSRPFAWQMLFWKFWIVLYSIEKWIEMTVINSNFNNENFCI